MNKEKKNIFLIGFMGAGKSTIARAIKQKLGYPVVEMDERIVKEQGMPQITHKMLTHTQSTSFPSI